MRFIVAVRLFMAIASLLLPLFFSKAALISKRAWGGCWEYGRDAETADGSLLDGGWLLQGAFQ